MLPCIALAIATARPVLPSIARQAATALAPQSAPQPVASVRSGDKDFDFELGTWRTKVRVLRNPLSGEAPNWAEYQGTSVVRPLLRGRANVVELSMDGPAGRIEGARSGSTIRGRGSGA